MNTNEEKSDEVPDRVPPEFARYIRQIRFPGFGVESQRKLSRAKVLVIGLGALGSVIANTLARAGVGFLRLVDRDFLERNNLQRQVLYDEQDVDLQLPKAIAAAKKLAMINSDVAVEPLVQDVAPDNIEQLCQRMDLILDGTDNFETRFLINDAAVKSGIPWVYGGCLGCDGQSMTILPGDSACLNCLMLDGPPPPGTTATCDSFGILSPIINVIASIQCSEAIKILSGNLDQVSRKLTVIGLWDNNFQQIDISQLRDAVDCPTCKQNNFEWLSGERTSHTAVLCGRNAIQLSYPERQTLDLNLLSERLAGLGEVQLNSFLLRFLVDGFTITAFPDGRAIISGTEDIAIAKKLYAQYLGA